MVAVANALAAVEAAVGALAVVVAAMEAMAWPGAEGASAAGSGRGRGEASAAAASEQARGAVVANRARDHHGTWSLRCTCSAPPNAQIQPHSAPSGSRA